MRKLKLFFACLLMAVLSIGQVWGDPAAVGTTLFSENFGSYSADDVPSGSVSTATGRVVYGSGSVTYTSTNGTGTKPGTTKIWNEKVASGTAPEILVGKQGTSGTPGSFKIAGIPSGGAQEITVSWKQNAQKLTGSLTGTGYSTTYNFPKPSAVGTVSFDITVDDGADATFDLTLTASSSNVRVDDILITVKTAGEGGAPATPTCATPTFTPTSGDFTGSINVTLACTTEGAAIHYTTDGTEPTASSATYTAAIPVSETTTIKAIAVADGYENSSIASKTYTKHDAYTTIQALFNDKTNTSTPVYVTFDGWKISGVKGGQAFLTDGTNGLIIYQNSHGFSVGDALSGTAACNLIAYKGAAEITGLTSTSAGLIVTAGSMGDAVAKTIDELGAVNTSALVTISNVTYDGTNLSDGTNSIKPYNGLFSSMSFENGKKYNVTGVLNYYDALQVMPRSAADIVEVVEEGAPANPTFSPAAGTYTSVQSVEISCETEGATIYYTTNGDAPTTSSTEYTAAIPVNESMTIKAIAVKNEKPSGVATAAYTINLPVSEEDQKTWNLAIDETATASENELTWTATYVSMSFAKANASTNANNYYPSTPNQTYTSTRAYKNSVITITPNGKQITSIVFEATSSGYATALKNSAWTNATAVADNTTITVTPTNGKNAISAVIGGTCGFTSVQVNYEAISATAPADPTFSVAAGEYTEVKSVELSCETDGATIYYTTDGSTPDNTSTEYTAAITVDENMTIKAIAYLGEEASGVAEAAYVINLPVSEEDQKTWDLSIDETATASADALTWTATYVDMSVTSGTAAANNYYPGTSGKSYTSTRFYNGATLTITPNGKQITSIVIETDGATPFKNATWTNGTATNVDKTVTITVTSPGAVTAVFQANATAFSVQVNYTAIDPTFPVAPTFSVEGGTYTSAQSVELSCATVSATIYYTTDGTAPSSTSTEYTSAIPVNEDMTIKAVAINGEKVGPVVTQVYKINLPLTTMDAILTRATAIGSTAEEVLITFNNWVVSGVGTDEKTVYVTDGSKGFIIYGSDHGFAVNDKISGTVACDLKLYNKVAEVVDLKANATGLTVTNDGEVNVASIALADLGAVNTGALIALSNMKYDGTYLTDGATSIKPYNSLYADAAFVEDHYYNVTGIYVHYNTTKEIAPRSAADIEELQATAPAMQWYVSNTKEETIGASHIIRVGDTFAPFFETNSNGSLTFTSSDPTIAEIDENTGVLTLKDVVGYTTITCAVAADVDQNLLADSKYFTLQVKAQATVDNVIFVAQFNDGENDKWLAMKLDMSALEVNYHDGKVWDLSAEDQVAITWKRTDDGETVTFQNPSNDYYLKGSTGSTMSVAAGETGHYSWHWEEAGFYTTLTNGTLRTPLYQGNAGAFKYYAVGNAGSTSSGGYTELPIVTAAVFDVTAVVNYVAQIGDNKYETLPAAVAAAQANATVKLIDNVDLMETGLTIGTNMTLDLNGFNIKAGEQLTNDINVPAGVKLTLVDNSANAEGKIYTEEAYTGSVNGYGVIRVAGEFLMQSGNIYAVIESDPANKGQFAVVIAAGGKVTVEGGQIKAGWYAISNNGNNTGSTIIVSGGELISTADFAIYNPAKESTVTVSGGVVYGAAGGIAMNRGELTVTGGTITSKDQGSTGTWGDGTGGLSNAAISASGKYESVEVEISGGTIIAEGTAVMITNGTTNPVEVAISGGQFSHVVPAEYCAPGYAPVTEADSETGKYGVEVAPFVQVRDELQEGRYYTMCLNKAVSAVHGGTIWRVLSKAENGTDVILEEVTGILEAGRPYIFNASAETLEVQYHGNEVQNPVTTGNNGLVGSFSKQQIAQSENNYIIYNNQLYFVNSDNVYVGAYRAYLNMLDVPAYSNEPQQGNAPGRRVTMTVHGEQTATDIDALNASETPVKVLRDGQIFILRGEKMYNVNGQIVK